MKTIVGVFVVAGLTFSGTHALAAEAAPEKPVDAQACFMCHATIKDLHSSGKHAEVNCASCHSGLEQHMQAPSPEHRPGTAVTWESCGACHQDQYHSFMQESLHRPARDEKSQLDNRAPNPYWDKLMAGHGFTKEHALTRSHKWMLIDHLVVDRSYGGRFQGKSGWQYILEDGKKSDVLKDLYPDNDEHTTFIPQAAAAANPVCMQCKSQDNILGWAYMGDKKPETTFSRESNVVEVARATEHGLNCFYCHDPHAAKPRIVRDALIQALTRPEEDTLWHKDPDRTKIEVIDMGMRGFDRKIALLERYDSRLLCGQCHVEYNCNPGIDPKTGERVTMADQRTNHFPFKDVFDLYDHYKNQISFMDFKHAFTGGLLWKGQHPEAETYYNSKHAKAGVSCYDCHTPKLKNEQGETYTSHFATTPRLMLQDTCLRCHGDWNAEQAEYVIDSIKAYGKGKMRKAEFWLSELIDKIVEGKKAGLAEDIIAQAQDQHLKAHILWEYWTAENSDGFHNPEMARESLTKSVDESMKGIKIVDEALAAKK
jgi:nitrite reductase (cytochrome c-552)